MSFLQVQQSLVTHRKTLRLAQLLGIDRSAVVGRLIALWAWCLDNAPDGCLGVEPTTGTDVGLLADILANVMTDVMTGVMGWDGSPGELEKRLIAAGFLDAARDAQGNQHRHLHDWQAWASQTLNGDDDLFDNIDSSDDDSDDDADDDADDEVGDDDVDREGEV